MDLVLMSSTKSRSILKVWSSATAARRAKSWRVLGGYVWDRRSASRRGRRPAAWSSTPGGRSRTCEFSPHFHSILFGFLDTDGFRRENPGWVIKKVHAGDAVLGAAVHLDERLPGVSALPGDGQGDPFFREPLLEHPSLPVLPESGDERRLGTGSRGRDSPIRPLPSAGDDLPCRLHGLPGRGEPVEIDHRVHVRASDDQNSASRCHRSFRVDDALSGIESCGPPHRRDRQTPLRHQVSSAQTHPPVAGPSRTDALPGNPFGAVDTASRCRYGVASRPSRARPLGRLRDGG